MPGPQTSSRGIEPERGPAPERIGTVARPSICAKRQTFVIFASSANGFCPTEARAAMQP